MARSALCSVRYKTTRNACYPSGTQGTGTHYGQAEKDGTGQGDAEALAAGGSLSRVFRAGVRMGSVPGRRALAEVASMSKGQS